MHAFGTQLTESTLDDEQFDAGFRARVGFVFQNSDAQLFSPTVRDEMAFGPLHLGFDRAEVERRVDDVLALLDIDGARRPGAVPALGRREEARGDRVGARHEPGCAPLRRTDGRARSAHAAVAARSRRSSCTGPARRSCARRTTSHRSTRSPTAASCSPRTHRIVACGSPAEILADRPLLEATNLVHTHIHRHHDRVHAHAHALDHHDPEGEIR